MVVFDDVRIVDTKLRVPTLKNLFIVHSVIQLSVQNPEFRHLLGTVKEKNQVRFSGLDDGELGPL